MSLKLLLDRRQVCLNQDSDRHRGSNIASFTAVDIISGCRGILLKVMKCSGSRGCDMIQAPFDSLLAVDLVFPVFSPRNESHVWC
jgi:hypothetical protein